MKYLNNRTVSAEENCVICGNPLKDNSNKQHQLLNELIEKNPNKCVACLEKIYAIKAYKDIKKHIPFKAGEYGKVSQEFDDVTFKYYFSILKKYDLIKSVNHDVFFLKEEDDFYEDENYKKYSPFLEETFKYTKTPHETNFVDLDLIMQEEQEIDKSDLNEVDLSDEAINPKKPIITIGEELETKYGGDDASFGNNSKTVGNEDTIESDVAEEKPKIISPPTVKHINISNLVHNDSKKSEDLKISYNNESLTETTIKNDKKEIKSEKKEVSDSKPLPQIKRINVSNLYKSKDSDSESNTKHEKSDKIIDVGLKINNADSEGVKEEINSESKVRPKDKIETPESVDETAKLKDEIKFENELTTSTDTIVNGSELENQDKTKKIRDVSKKTKEIQKEESEHKIPPKKSNGQYSLHKGISYKIGVYKWTADIREKGKLKSLGLFDSEEEAYNARQDYIHKKNPNKKDSEIPPKKSNNRFSLHDRVDYDLNNGKWFAYVHEYGEDKFLGYFNTEKEAYSRQCKYLNIFVPTKQKNGQYSLHNGVSFNKRYCKWTSTIRGRKKNKFLGYFCSELDALKAIEVYVESNGKILNIWTPPKELSDGTTNDSNGDKFIKTFSYEPAGNEYMQVTLNGQIKDDEELFEVLYKLNSFFIKISTLEINDMIDFISLRASFKIKSDVLNKLIMMLKEDSWVK